MTARLRRGAAVAGVLACLLITVSCTDDGADGGADDGADGGADAGADADKGAAAPSTAVLAPGTGLGRYHEQTVQWVDCGDGLECATVLVPLDYSRPGGATVGLAVNRLPSAGAGRNAASLIVNPGGPGGSGTELVEQGRSALFDSLNASYDVVGVDPRGVGGSEPIECLGTAGVDRLLASDPGPDTPAEVANGVAILRELGRGCLADAPGLLAHMSTSNVARDLEVIREVLDEPRMNYLGFSYGTLLGAVYAELFPDAVGRMVLDGAIDPSLRYDQLLRSQAVGFQTALEAYAADCVAKPGCPIGTDAGTGLARIRALLDGLDAEPLPTDDPGRPLTEGLATYGISFALYAESMWPGLTLALDAALDDQDGQPLLLMADLYAHRGDDGYEGNLIQAYNAVSCLDDRGEPTVGGVEDAVDAFQRVSPVLGAALGWQLMACAVWPVEASLPLPARVRAEGAAPILVVGTTRDPATPYAQAKALGEQLDSGVLLTREGDGHTAYGQGNDCIDEAVEAYLIDGTVPVDGTRC